MSNVLKMELQESIKVLHRKGWSHRRIASELGVNRRTVKRYDAKFTGWMSEFAGPKRPQNGAITDLPYMSCSAQW
jgi:transposase